MKRTISLITIFFAFAMSAMAIFPINLKNTSLFSDEELYIGIIGQNLSGQYCYFDLDNNSATNVTMSFLCEEINTLHKKPGDIGYANIFKKLSEITDNTIYIDKCQACRMFVGFKSPMYIHAKNETEYTGADLNNQSDPNRDFRWEIIEFTYDINNVMFINTTRVDAFQYPMGIELFGDIENGANNAYMKRGDLLDYTTIMNRWQEQLGETIYAKCSIDNITTDNLGGIIMQPSKVAAIKGSNLFDQYINSIWTTFSSKTLHADMGELGVWKGKVNEQGEFVMTRTSDNAVGKVPNKPSTNDAIEGAGSFATGSGTDKALQAMFCGAVNRGMIDLTKADGELQYWGDQSKFYTMNTCNEYVKFFHSAEVSHETYTYAFAYDDTFDQSSTCATKAPSHVNVWIGGFAEDPGEGDTSASETTDTPGSPSGTTGTELAGDVVGSGTTAEGLNYSYAITQEGENVTYTFVANNASNFTGLVNHLWDNTKTFGELLDRNTHTFTYPIGTTVKVACKWAYAGGMTVTPYIEYVMKEKSTLTGVTDVIESKFNVYPNPSTEYIIIDGCNVGSPIYIYDITGKRVVTAIATSEKTKVSLTSLKTGRYIVNMEDKSMMIIKR
ncbi:MAG: beta-1,3-glucanase family protein [Bacteroidales bacterium]|nr:beta-1,3-glucanase family protein [Bacteroidales bacterium]